MFSYKEQSDLELFDLLKEGDSLAFTEIYQRYWASMYFYAFKLFNDANDAEDAVQEVLAYIWNKRLTIHITGSVASYLYSSVHHRLLDVIKRKKTYNKYLDSLSDFMDRGQYTTDEQIREKELVLKIERAIESLPAKMKQIFNLSRSEYLSQKSIAKKLNISDKTVKKQINNAIKILRSKIQHNNFLTFF